MDLARRVAARYASKKEDGSRDKGNGQYTHSRWSRLCKLCGHPVGQHTAEKSEGFRPCIHGDMYPDHCECPVFTPTAKFMTDEDFERYNAGKFGADELRALRAPGKSNVELDALWKQLEEKARRKK
jgi:hypothetical protein